MGVETPNGSVTVTTANWLTILRVVIVPFFWVFFRSENAGLNQLATLFFILGAITDYLDGYLARKYNQITPFGKFMDPLADKLLVLSAFWLIFLWIPQQGYWWFNLVCLVLISFREALLTILRMFKIGGKASVVTSHWGKWKTAIHIVFLITLLISINLSKSIITPEPLQSLLSSSTFYIIVSIMFLIAMLLSVISGTLYLVNLYQQSKR